MPSSDDGSVPDNEQLQEPDVAPVNHTAIPPNDHPDVMRILISTDNHLGYAERDAVRGMDSFAAFEEVLYLAKKYSCDMVLIAGDLFHDNRPSRNTMHKTMEILRRYCMGQEPVKIEFMSDAAAQLQSAVTVNYQDANYSVGLPLFSIHGNHDDPSRDQGGGELLAALDLLAMSNLINYFGRQDQVNKIEISPLLLQKGNTKIALYGLGSLRDERLNRMWEQKKVRFLRPEVGDDAEEDSFFNIFALHQNRDLGRGSKNCVHESMIPDWMDIVVWGHEHECLIEFVESIVGTYRITQPGSSVATSLVAGEAQTKKVGVLDIRGKQFRLRPIPLTQVRSFVTVELSLRQHRSELDPDDPKIDSKVASVLEDEVRYIAHSAREKHKTLLNDARRAGNDAAEEGSSIKYKLEKPNEVLVRIRVEHSGFSSLNNQRFGAKFVGDVANPSDMLLFYRKKDPNLASKVKKNKIQPMAPEEIEQISMEDLIKQQLDAGGDGKLQIFGQESLSEALEDYVEKSVTAAITDVAADILARKTTALITMSKANNDVAGDVSSFEREAEVLDVLHRESQAKGNVSMIDDDEKQGSERLTGKNPKKRKPGKANSFEVDDSFEIPKSRPKKGVSKKSNPLDSDDDDEIVHATKPRGKKTSAKNSALNSDVDDEDEDDDVYRVPKATAKRAPAPKKAASRRYPSDSEELSDVDEEPVKVAPKSRSKRAAAKKPVKYAFGSDDEEDPIVASDDDDDDNDAVAVDPRSKRKKPTASRSKTSKSTKTATSFAARDKKKTNGTRRSQFDDSDAEEVEYMGSSEVNLDADWGSAATRSQF